MRTRALGALIAAFVLHGASPVAAQAPQRNYLGRLYRSAIERETLVGHDARRLGMGSAGAAAGVSPDAVVWNPAALGAVSQMTVGVMDSGSADTSATRAGAASGAVPLVDLAADARGAVGASAWIGDWGPDAEKQRSFLAGYGTPFGPVSVGGALRHERHYFGADTLSAWTADLGMQAAGVTARGHSWRAGLVASRLGRALRDQRGLLAPRAFNPTRVGAGGHYSLGAGSTLATEFAYVADTRREARDRVRARVGAEQLLLGGRFAVRAGYNSIANYDRISHGLASVGASANVAGAGIDYAFVTGSNGLGDKVGSRHYVSFRVAWAGAHYAPDTPALREGLTLPKSATPTAVSVRNGAFSPNGDGVRDAFVLDVGADEADAAVVVTGPSGAVVRTVPVSDRMVASWDGRTEDGAQAADGLYRWDAMVSDRAVRSGLALLDATPPALTLSRSPVALTSGSDAPHGAVSVSVEEANAVAGWSLTLAQNGSVVAMVDGDTGMPTALAVADMSDVRPGGAYEATLRVADEAGSEASQTVGFTVLDLRAHATRVEDDTVYVEMPSTYFEAADAELSREGRELVAAASRDDALYIAVAGTDDELSGDRVGAVRAALVAAGMPPDHVATAPAVSRDDAPSAAARLAISNRRLGAVGAYGPTPHGDRPDGTYRVLVGSFRERARAEVAAAELSASGFEARVRGVRLPSGAWFRVVVGALDTREAVDALRKELEPHVSGDTVVLTPAIP